MNTQQIVAVFENKEIGIERWIVTSALTVHGKIYKEGTIFWLSKKPISDESLGRPKYLFLNRLKNFQGFLLGELKDKESFQAHFAQTNRSFAERHPQRSIK